MNLDCVVSSDLDLDSCMYPFFDCVRASRTIGRIEDYKQDVGHLAEKFWERRSICSGNTWHRIRCTS